MKSPLHLGDLPEVDLPTRFLFFYNGPPGLENQDLYTNIGIALAVAFTGDMPLKFNNFLKIVIRYSRQQYFTHPISKALQ